MDVRLEQSQNVPSLILVIPLGKLTEDNLSQSRKALSSIVVTVLGIVMDVSCEQCSKAFPPILVIPSGRVTEERFKQSRKAQFPTLVTPLAMITVVIGELFEYHGALFWLE